VSGSTARVAALSAELASRVLTRESAIVRIVRDAPAEYATLRASLASRVARSQRRVGALSRSVLVVDDDPAQVALLAAVLRQGLGVAVHTASTVEAASLAWVRHRCGVAVVDLHLRGELGDDFARSLDRGVRVVLLSGVADAATLSRAAARCGALPVRKPAPDLTATVRGLLDAVAPPLWCHAIPDALIDVSEDLAALVGYTPDDLGGLPWRALIHPDDIARSECEQRHRAGQGVEGFVQRWRHRDGRYIALRWDVTPMADGEMYAVAHPV